MIIYHCSGRFFAHKEDAESHRKRGHPLSGDNLHINPRGARVCKECGRRAKRAYVQKNS